MFQGSLWRCLEYLYFEYVTSEHSYMKNPNDFSLIMSDECVSWDKTRYCKGLNWIQYSSLGWSMLSVKITLGCLYYTYNFSTEFFKTFCSRKMVLFWTKIVILWLKTFSNPDNKCKFSPLDLLFCLLFGLGDFFRDGWLRQSFENWILSIAMKASLDAPAWIAWNWIRIFFLFDIC